MNIKNTRHSLWSIILLLCFLVSTGRAQEAAQGEVFFNYGSVSGGISQYYYSSFTIGQPVVGPYFGTDYQGALGFWSRFLVSPAPPIITASEGDFPDRVLLNWGVDPLSPASDLGFKIYRDGAFLASVDPATLQFIDFNVIPGNFYNYEVRGVNGFGDGYPGAAVGFVNPNGKVTGQVTTINDNPVAGVQVTLEPTIGNSLAFNGIDESVTIPYNTGYTAGLLTVSTWVKNVGTSDDDVVVDLGRFNNNNWWINATSTGFSIGIGEGSTSKIFDVPLVSETTDWHHLAFTYNSSDLNVYLDGSLQGTLSATMSVAEEWLYLGGNPNETAAIYFGGQIDDLRIYERQLSQTEIIRTMNATVPSSAPGLVAYWKFDEGTGYKVFDLSENQLDGYMTGVTFSDDRPNVLNAGVTDETGYYLIDGINYGGGQSFTARPSKDFQFNNGLEFNASNNQFATFSGFNPTDTGAIEIWFKPSVLSGQQSILSNGSIFDLSLNNTNLVLTFNGSSQTIGTIPTTDYFHVAINYSPSSSPNITTYLNGDPAGSFSASIPSDWNASGWNIGRSAAADNYFTGLVDEIVFFKNIRTEAQVELDETGIVITDLDLLAYFSLNESLGIEIIDQSPNNTGTGTISGATWTSVTANPETVPHEFNPASRIVSLSPSNTDTDNVNFEDVSTVSVSGFVRFEGTSCFAENVEILVNGQSNLPPIYTDPDGKFVADFEPGTSFTLTPRFGNHTFIPAIWDINNIVVPKAGIVFTDQAKRDVEGVLAGGICEKNVIPEGKEVQVHLVSDNNCFRDTFFFNGPGKKFKFKKVPPISYTVSIIAPELPNIGDYFTPEGGGGGAPSINLEVADTTLAFIYRSPITIETSPLDTNKCGIPTLTQFQKYRIDVSVFEEYEGGTCPVDSIQLAVDNQIEPNFNIDTIYNASSFRYWFNAGPPRIEGDHTNPITFSATSLLNDQNDVHTVSAVVIGNRERFSEYATTTPELPLMILRDPPGDASYSYLSEGDQICEYVSMNLETSFNSGVKTEMKMGPEWSSGLGYVVETDVVNDITASFNVSSTFSHLTEQQICVTANNTILTKGDDLVVGAEQGGDVYMGAAMNLIFGITDKLELSEDSCGFVVGEEIFIRPDGFDTQYMYSEFHIRNVVIPDLLQNLQDTVSAEMWEQVLLKNEETKAAAIFSENLSFDGGVVYEYSKATEATKSTTFSTEVTVASDLAVDLGLFVGDVGGSTEFSYGIDFTVGGSTKTEQTRTNEVGYHLEDNDVSDNFSINILEERVYGTPVFDVVAGQSSCPHEPGTQNRDEVAMTVLETTKVNVPETEPAVFNVTLGNVSPSEDRRIYMLNVIGSSNGAGAVVKINGQPTTDPILYDLDYLETIDATVTVEKGPVDFQYDSIMLVFYADCEKQRALDIGIDVDPKFEKVIALNAHFIESCSDVEIASPAADWVVTPAHNNTLPIVLDSYNAADTDLEFLTVNYRPIGGNGAWIEIGKIASDTLDPISETIYWDVTLLADGPFEIQSVSQCTGLLPAGVSTVVQGKLERQPPEQLGLPQPSDGILSGADQIYIEFSEHIDCSDLKAIEGNAGGYVNLINTETNEPIDIEITCSENSIYITPIIQNVYIENKNLRAVVEGIKDLAGNSIPEAIEWEFYVDRNPLKWSGGDIIDYKYEDDSWLVSRIIQNVGGQPGEFTLENIPSWITPSISSGIIEPGGSTIVVFTVPDDIASGRYQDTLLLHNNSGMGDEPLVLDLAVLCHPPEWEVNPADYEYNMSFTVELDIEGTVSEDEFDLVAAFVDGELQGLGSVETVAVSSTETKHLVFLTVFHNAILTGEITFQIWDASDCLLYGSILETYSFVNGGVHGTPQNPDVLHTQNIVLREIPVTNGWNWISFNLDMPDKSVNTVLESLEYPENATLKSKEPFSQYSSGLGMWIGNLNELGYREMYKYKGTTNDTISLLGHPIDPDTVQIPIEIGWNWIGYIPQQGASLDDALSSLTPLNGDIIKGRSTFAQYVAGTGWIGSLNYMEAPNGYLLKSATGGVLQPFQGDGTPQLLVGGEERNNGMAGQRSSNWEVNAASFEHSMTMVAWVQKDSLSILKEGDEVAAFVNDEVRGVATPIYIEPFDAYMLFLTIHANEEGETVEFKYYSTNDENVHVINESTTFMINENEGTVDEPEVLTLATVSATTDLSAVFKLTVQPNPFKESTNINFTLPQADIVTITVVDVVGNLIRKQKLDLTAGLHSFELNASAGMGGAMLDNGMYIVTLKGSEGQVSEKVLLVK